MTPELRSAVRRALQDNPARSHADIARLFGIDVDDVFLIVYEGLTTAERAEWTAPRPKAYSVIQARERLLKTFLGEVAA